MAAILIVEDEHALGSALSLAVRRLGHLPTLAASGAAACELHSKHRFDAVVLDIGLPDISGLEVLDQIRNTGSNIPVLIITAHATLDHAITSQKLGVADYLIKPLDLGRFEQSISALVAKGILIAEPIEPRVTTLIGAAPSMHPVFLGIARACTGGLPVLVHGPCGSGKTLAARVIHANSGRSGETPRFVECGTIRDHAVLQNLFADTTGTLVLEDLTGLDPTLQGALADIMAQTKAKASGLIATMSGDPREAVRDGLLRPDVFYAFSALTIAMPSLRERTGDIPALSRFFHGMRGDALPGVEITAPALCAMQAYAWPGNVRELRHVLEHAHAMSRGGPVFPGHLPPHVSDALRTSGSKVVSGELDAVLARWLDSQMGLTPEESWHYDSLLDEIESSMLRHLLERFENRPTRLAAALRMNRATLRQKLRRAGLGGDS
jgi:DNA-binding NtrC family response regulator